MATTPTICSALVYGYRVTFGAPPEQWKSAVGKRCTHLAEYRCNGQYVCRRHLTDAVDHLVAEGRFLDETVPVTKL